MSHRTKSATGIGRFTLGLALVVAAVCLYASLGNLSAYTQYTVELTGIYIIVTAGLNIAVGLTGQFQMAQPAMMAISAYTVAVLVLDSGWALAPAAIVAVVLTAAVAGIVGLLTARLRTHYLLLGTFALQTIVVHSIRQFDGLTGGVNGHAAPVTIGIAGTEFSGSTSEFTVLVIVCAALGLWIAQWLAKSNLGLVMKATRHSDLLLQSTGTNPAAPRLVAVILSGLYAAIGGLLVGPLLIFLSPDSFGTTLVLLFVLMVVIGGTGSVIGVAVGTAVLNWILQSASTSETAAVWPIIFGLALMLCLIVAPGGLASLTTSLTRRLGVRAPGWQDTGIVGVTSTEASLAPDVAGPGLASSGIQICGIGRRYGGVTALTDVTFDVEAGTVHGLIGPNGSGKTTLLDIISGFNTPDDGSVAFCGKDITKSSPASRARLGIRRSFQHPLLIEDGSALENVLLGGSDKLTVGDHVRLALGTRNRERLGRARAVLALVGLEHRASVSAQDLSYGERKLLDIGRALMARPRVLILDEPVAGLPGSAVARVEAVIRKLNALGYAVIIVEHNMTLIMSLCSRVTVLANGHHLITAAPEQVQRDERVIEVYLGSNVRSEETTA